MRRPSGELRERTWHVNATNECKLCHNAGPRFVLGFVPNQLDCRGKRRRRINWLCWPPRESSPSATKLDK